MTKFLIHLTLLFLIVISCAKNDNQQVKSVVGLEAGQDSSLAGGDGHKTFIAVSNWFQTFKTGLAESVTTTDNFSQVSMEEVKAVGGQHPTYLKMLNAYFDHELARITAFAIALAAGDDMAVRGLLEQETLEIMDIILVMFMPAYGVPSNDLFAKLLKNAKSGDFIDHYAEKFLTTIYADRNPNAIVSGLKAEQQSYLAALEAQYLGTAENREAFQQLLNQTKSGLLNLKCYINQGSGEGSQICADTSGVGEGMSGVHAGFVNALAGMAANPSNQSFNLIKGNEEKEGGSPIDATAVIGKPDDMSSCVHPDVSGTYCIDDVAVSRETCSGREGLSLIRCKKYLTSTPGQLGLSAANQISGEVSAAGAEMNLVFSEEKDLGAAFARKVQNQGYEGACTAFAMAQILEIQAMAIEPEERNPEFDARAFWASYGAAYNKITQEKPTATFSYFADFVVGKGRGKK